MKRYQKPYCGLGISFGFAPGFGEFLRVNVYKNGPPGATASPKRRENIAGGRGSRLPSISRHSGRAAAPQELPGAILPVRKKKSTVVQDPLLSQHEPQILARAEWGTWRTSSVGATGSNIIDRASAKLCDGVQHHKP